MKGVKYAAMTALGPSGTRPEHANEALGIRQKAIARRLAHAMLKVQNLASEGRLPEEARWLTKTRLAFLENRAAPCLALFALVSFCGLRSLRGLSSQLLDREPCVVTCIRGVSRCLVEARPLHTGGNN